MKHAWMRYRCRGWESYGRKLSSPQQHAGWSELKLKTWKNHPSAKRLGFEASGFNWSLKETLKVLSLSSGGCFPPWERIYSCTELAWINAKSHPCSWLLTWTQQHGVLLNYLPHPPSRGIVSLSQQMSPLVISRSCPRCFLQGRYLKVEKNMLQS